MVAKYVWSPGVLLICLATVRSRGKENIPRDKNVIFVCNHESLLDIPALFIASPTFLYFIAKAELKKMPFVGWAIWAAGMVFIDRSDRKKAMQSMREAGEKAKRQKKNIVSFPEGTRNKDGQLKLFKRGTFLIAQQTNITVVPCAIKGTREVWPSEVLKIKPGKVTVIFGEPLDPADHADKSPEEFANFAQQKVIELRASIQ